LEKLGSSLKIRDGGNSKDYFTIDIEARRGNAIYNNCVVFYGGDEFNAEEILEETKTIIEKAKNLTL